MSAWYGFILAGGRGTRFWPKSRQRTPKQLLNLLGGRSLIQQTVERLRPVIPPERIWILTNEHVRDAIARQLPEVPRAQIIAEPAQRNTAPCIGLGARLIESIDKDAVMGVFPADHVITRPARFVRLLRPAFRTAEKGKLVVLGIQPRWAETGYGYVEFPDGVRPGSLQPRPVLRFREKPDPRTAAEFLAAGRFYWNSGMFFWRAGVFLDLLRRFLPGTASVLDGLPVSGRSLRRTLAACYPACDDISVDYAVLEKADGVVGLAAGDIGWNDAGSWNALWELLPKDAAGNAASSELIAESSRGNLVDARGKLTALLGVDNLVVVDTPDALLVVDRGRAQEVSGLVKLLERRRRRELL
jgi:mannose-1-phosphate guanylyltransferase